MADVTGALRVEFGGKTYTLRLTMLVLAELQAEHGMDFHKRLEAQDGMMPDFRLMVDIVARALMRGDTVEPEKARLLADDMLTADQDVLARLMQAAFPDVYAAQAASGNAGTATAAKAG